MGERAKSITLAQKNVLTLFRSFMECILGFKGLCNKGHDIVYRPGITAQLKDYLSNCGICNLYHPKQCKEPLKPHDVPDLLWEKVGVDLFVMDRQSFLIPMGHYSGYFEVQDLSSMTSIRVITVLKS